MEREEWRGLLFVALLLAICWFVSAETIGNIVKTVLYVVSLAIVFYIVFPKAIIALIELWNKGFDSYLRRRNKINL